MLNLYLITVGERMPRWVEEGFAEYQKRVRGRMTLKSITVPAVRRGRNTDLARVVLEEERRLEAAMPSHCRLIALDRQGRSLTTLEMAARMEDWLQDAEQVAMVVGGPEGLSEGFLRRSRECWSLSALTLAHPVVRVVLAEQIYRCWSILEGHPYHR